MLFDFLSMAGNYEQRKVDRFECDYGFVSTARVTDSRDPFETGIQYDLWGDSVVVVQTYSTKDEAVIGHQRYVELMVSKQLPKDKPKDAGTNEIMELLRSLDGQEAP